MICGIKPLANIQPNTALNNTKSYLFSISNFAINNIANRKFAPKKKAVIKLKAIKILKPWTKQMLKFVLNIRVIVM